ncbi:MAG: YihY/virulence factor BrkB family protein [Actinomycetota bacterium]|nr:YihY/virulence factor BrkB family protein [Actinomycetota bacterium]
MSAKRSTPEPKGTERDSGRWALVKRTVAEFREDGMTDWAAALTYYALLSLFPALIALTSLLGLFADPKEATSTITEIVTRIGPESAADTFAGPIESITSNRSSAGVLFFAGLATALWSASSYVGAFSRASNVIYETSEGRPFWKLRPLQIAVTLLLVVLVAVVALALMLTGPIVDAVAGPLGIGETAVSVWNIAKWPALLVAVMVIFAVLYYTSPNVKLRGFKWITPGSVLAVVIWLLASVLFALYVANFGSYDKTYGTLGGLVALLVWLWITNLAILLGAELNSELERGKQFEERVPGAEKKIQLAPRDEPDRPQTA